MLIGIALLSFVIVFLGFLGTTETGDLISNLIGYNLTPLKHFGESFYSMIDKIEATFGYGSSGFRWVFLPLAISLVIFSISFYVGLQIL